MARRIAGLAVAVTMAAGAFAEAKAPLPFACGERVVFLGDSITHGCGYVARLRFLADARAPETAPVLMSAGISGDWAGGGLERLDWDVFPKKPDRVFVMFGMNDFGNAWAHAVPTEKEAANRRRIEKTYRAKLNAIVDALTARGVRCTLMTPSPYDEYSRDPKLPEPSFDRNSGALSRAAEIVRDIADRRELELVDLHAPMTALVKAHPELRLCGTDRVHPGGAGHLLMAVLIADAMWLNPHVTPVKDSYGASVKVYAKKLEKPSFTHRPRTLQVPFTDEYRALDALCRFTERLNLENLRIPDLEPGRWTLSADGKARGAFTREEFDAGVNLAPLPTPAHAQARKAWDLALKLREVEVRLRDIAYMTQFLKKFGTDLADEKACFARLDKWLEDSSKTHEKVYVPYWKQCVAQYKKWRPQQRKVEEEFARLRAELHAACTPPAATFSFAPAK